jgi:Ctr copper transporter family
MSVWCAGIRDIMLFRRLVPRTDGQYAGVFFAVLITGILASALRLLRGALDTQSRVHASQVQLQALHASVWYKRCLRLYAEGIVCNCARLRAASLPYSLIACMLQTRSYA